MEWIGWISLAIILCYSAYPGKVKKLESKVKALEKERRRQEGGSDMSKLISELVGKECSIKTTEELSAVQSCTILDVDEEWIKFSYQDKKSGVKTKIMRIENVEHVELLGE